MAEYTELEYVVDDGVATIWLNRPEKRNALSATLFAELDSAAAEAEADPLVRIVLIRGRGVTFCAGGDLSMLQQEAAAVPTSIRVASQGAHTFARFYEMPKPTVAVVQGHAVAGGFELMISTDFAIAASDAKIGDFHIRRALLGGCGPIYRLPRLIGMRRAKEIILSGRTMSGEAAERINLVNVAAPPERLDDAVQEFIRPFRELSPMAMAITKMALNRGLDGDTQTLMTMEHFACSLMHQTDDGREGIDSFLEHREPHWTGS
jgi:enoyl-CoA hydratase/carnithine racemase